MYLEAFPDGEDEVKAGDPPGEELMPLLARMAELRRERQIVRDREKALTEALERLNPIAVEHFNARELQSLKSNAFGTAYIRRQIMPKVADSEALVAWFDEHDLGALAKRAVHPQTLKAWANERMEEGGELPPDTVLDVAYMRETVEFRK